MMLHRMTKPLAALLMAAGLMTSFLSSNAQAQGEAHAATAPTIKAGGVATFDLPDSTAQSIGLDIVGGRFSDYSVGKMHLQLDGVDLRNGNLSRMKADLSDGFFDVVKVDTLSLATKDFSFNTYEFINFKRFVLNSPVNALVSVVLTEPNLNYLVSNPKTLEKIHKALRKKTGGLDVLQISSPRLSLSGSDRVKLSMDLSLAGQVALPIEMDGKLGIRSGNIALSKLQLSSNGQQMNLPVDITSVFEDEINKLIDLQRLGKNSFVIVADQVKTVNNRLEINGHAALTKLSFGN